MLSPESYVIRHEDSDLGGRPFPSKTRNPYRVSDHTRFIRYRENDPTLSRATRRRVPRFREQGQTRALRGTGRREGSRHGPRADHGAPEPSFLAGTFSSFGVSLKLPLSLLVPRLSSTLFSLLLGGCKYTSEVKKQTSQPTKQRSRPFPGSREAWSLSSMTGR